MGAVVQGERGRGVAPGLVGGGDGGVDQIGEVQVGSVASG